MEHIRPADIERRSMEIITSELNARGITLPAENAPIIKRVIHTTADFDVFPGLELRLKERTAYRNGELISMTRREFATLVYLAKHPFWVFSAGQIYEEVWGGW